MKSNMSESGYFAGPLNLDREKMTADTALGAVLDLQRHEFDALDMLAMREGEALTFEQLYEAVWKTQDDSIERSAARFDLERLIEKVSLAGEGFMWIDFVPETGYTFRTHWGHNWNTHKSLATQRGHTSVHPPGKSAKTADQSPANPTPGIRLTIQLIAGIAAAVLVLFMLVMVLLNVIRSDNYAVIDQEVPLSPYESVIDCDITNCIILNCSGDRCSDEEREW